MSSHALTAAPRDRNESALAPMLRLDVASLASWGRMAPLLVLATGVMAFTSGVQVAVLMLTVGSAFMALNPFTMDERYRLPLLYGGLPVSRRTVVTSHYVIAVGAFALASALVVPAALLSPFFFGLGVWDEVGAGWLMLAVASAVVALFLPLVVRFGVKSLAYAYVAGLGLVAALITLARVLLRTNLPLDRLADWLAANTTAVMIASVVAVVGLWVASYLVSVRWFEAKDL